MGADSTSSRLRRDFGNRKRKDFLNQGVVEQICLQKVKRQRTATPSSIKDLEDVLRTVVVKRVFTLTTSSDFVEPTKEALQEAAETLRRSLFTDFNTTPEQPAREFLADCKVLLRQTSYHSEVRMPGDIIKRADAITVSEGLPQRIMELKKYITSTGSEEFNRALGQVAVYVATGFYNALSVPFVILTGYKSEIRATFNATFGVCIVEKNRDGAVYVREIHHEKEVTEVQFNQRGDEVHFDKAEFVDVLARISALGQDYTPPKKKQVMRLNDTARRPASLLLSLCR